MPTKIAQQLAIVLLSLGWHCAHAQQQQQRQEPPQARQQDDFLNAPDRVQWEAGGLYDGRFDDGTPFQIVLAYPVPTEAAGRNGLTQMTWYSRAYLGTNAGTPARLLTTGGTGALMALAVAGDEGVAGDDHLSVTLAPDRASGRGVWTGAGAVPSADSSAESAPPARRRSFTLTRSVPYTGIVVKRPASADLAAASSYYREHGFVFSAFFPTLGDADADAWIRRKAGHCSDVGECANEVEVRWHSPALVSLDANNWGDSGGAHGVGHSETRQYRIGNGAMTPLELDAFIDPGRACMDQVSSAIVARLRARGMTGADEAGLDARRAVKFTPTPGGIAFHYDSYEAGPYAQGAPTVFVPRQAMGDCVTYLPAAD